MFLKICESVLSLCWSFSGQDSVRLIENDAGVDATGSEDVLASGLECDFCEDSDVPEST